MKTALLLLAYAFPPENVSGAARPYRFYRYLPEFGISPHVITASPQDCVKPDVLFVRDEPRDFLRQSWSWHIERIVRKLLLPGELGLITWSRKAAAQGCRLIRMEGRAVLLSTSPPISPHLAALQIKRSLGIPWIADFRDPMVPTSLGKIAVSRMKIYSALEAFFLREADAVIANTDAVFNLWSDRYPCLRKKFYTIWNGFDPEEIISPASIPLRCFRHLVHIGELYGGRHPGLILDSIQRLITSGALAPDSVRLSLIGTSSDDIIPNIHVLRQLAEAGVVEYIPSLIPQDRARFIACQADALVLLQPQSDVQVPAKLFEYVRIGRPILAFIRRDSCIERILYQSGIPYRALYPDDRPEEVDGKMLEFLLLPNDPISPSKWFTEQFNVRDQTQTLASIINTL